MASEQGVTVQLYIYDLSRGMATMLSPMILGEQPELISKSPETDLPLGRTVEGLWHTSVVAFEREYFYGSGGVTSCAPGGTQLGAPDRVERLGETFVPFAVFADYLQGLATSAYTGNLYRLFEHNCNHFSDEVAGFLCGARVPKHILQQPEVLPPPLRAALTALLESMLPAPTDQVYSQGVRHVREESPEYHTLNNQIEEARIQSAALEARRSTLAEKLARKERRKEKKRRKQLANGDTVATDDHEMSEAVESAPRAEELSVSAPGPSASTRGPDEFEARRQEEMRRRAIDPPILYPDIDGSAEFEKLEASLPADSLDETERQSLDELRQYLVAGEGSWVLGDEFLTFIGRILSDSSMPGAARVSVLRCLSAAALRDDVSLLLHQDRRTHALLNYAARIEHHPLPEQEALTLFMCNLFENLSSSEWLLYISEWDFDGQPLSNIRATTKVCVHAVLSESEELRDLGTALMHNVATKEVKTVVFDEVCVELGMALLQLLSLAPREEIMFRALKALARLAAHSQEVPQLVAIVGPDPTAFRGTSPRIDEQIDLIMQKVK